LIDLFSCPLREEDKSRPHNLARDSSWVLIGLKGLPNLHYITMESGGEQIFRFEEGRYFQRSLELRVSIKDDAETQIDVSEGAQPQVSSTPVSRVIGSPCTTSGSQSRGV
jgi:hypothetical protein